MTLAVTSLLKLTVSAGLPTNTALHGLVVPEHVEELRLAGVLQPVKVDPPPALALNVTIAPLSDTVILGEHVLVTVCEATLVPVPPHETGALTVPMFGVIVTEPLPMPAKVRFKLRESVKLVSAQVPDGSPVAIRWNVTPKSCTRTWYTSLLLNAPLASACTSTVISACVVGASWITTCTVSLGPKPLPER